ncbi:MAG: carbamoyl transferase [Candidatus Aenigmarchaeota archaeon]|nr:carbamoyl transferase [Candidatus Aenigmarchaeota archaeon]
MKVLGLTTAIHDTSASVVIGGKVVAASLEERFDRIKHSGNFPVKSIRFCLERAKINNINSIDKVVVGMDWMERAKSRFNMRFSKDSPESTKKTAEQAILDINMRIQTENVLRKEFGYRGEISFLDHYDCHAAACYFPSGFSSAAILILDGAGESASARIYSANGGKLERLIQVDYPNSLGRFYGWITDYLGFKMECDEGKVMALASYGNGGLIPEMRKVLKVKSDLTYDLDLSYFDFPKDNTKGVSEKFIRIFGPKREKGDKITKRHQEIAKAAQTVLEECILSMTKLAKNLTKEKHLCIGGGVALNSVANGKIVYSNMFKDIYIYPASGDDGSGLGAALLASSGEKEISCRENQNPFLGYESSEQEILKSIEKHKLKYTKPKDLHKEAAELISKGSVIGWFSGKSEMGPRALGNRSILADPRDPNNKDRVNSKIKFREGFRPFAPTVLEEFAGDYFEMNGTNSPYMILALQVKTDKGGKIPAVVHVDNTARIQTINKNQNKNYWKIINEFYKITGVPVLLNTSFNREGEPIVNKPEEAIEAFLGSGLDAIVLDDMLIIK